MFKKQKKFMWPIVEEGVSRIIWMSPYPKVKSTYKVKFVQIPDKQDKKVTIECGRDCVV